MIVPKNEGKICDAVVKALEKWTGEPRREVRRPETDGVGPPVDLRLKLGDQDYAIEHTLIESFENQIRVDAVAAAIVRHIKTKIPDPFPSPAYCELQFPLALRVPKGERKRARALAALVAWVRATERTLRKRNASRLLPVRNPHMAND